MIERLIALGVPVASLAGAGWLLRSNPSKAAISVGRDNDIGPWVGPHQAVWAILATAVGMLFVALHLEVNRSLSFFFPPLRLPMLSLLWIAMCAFLLREYRLRPSGPMLTLVTAFIVGLVLKLLSFDLVSWSVLDAMRYAGDSYSFLGGAMRLLDFSAVIAFLCCGCWLLVGREDARVLSRACGVAAVTLLFIFLSLEVNTFLYHYVPGLRAGGVSILWSLFALSLIGSGIWKDIRWIRYVGLALFAVVAWKVLFADLAHLDQLYRIVAFILLGVLVLSGSFMYLKYRPVLSSDKDKENE